MRAQDLLTLLHRLKLLHPPGSEGGGSRDSGLPLSVGSDGERPCVTGV